jgi:hypothetical protein
MVLYAYVLCLCILALSRIPQYNLERQTPTLSGGSVTEDHQLEGEEEEWWHGSGFECHV